MTYLLDTSALLAHYRDEAGADAVQAIFDENDHAVLIASVTLTEFARRLVSLGVEADDALAIADGYVEAIDAVVPVDAVVAKAAFELMQQTPARLPMVDALIAACALSNNATMVHRDQHMRAIPSEILAQIELLATA